MDGLLVGISLIAGKRSEHATSFLIQLKHAFLTLATRSAVSPPCPLLPPHGNFPHPLTSFSPGMAQYPAHISSSAGLFMAVALCVEMGFLGLTFAVRASENLPRPAEIQPLQAACTGQPKYKAIPGVVAGADPLLL
eukprot:753000-Hanusia_phi.AAC.3